MPNKSLHILIVGIFLFVVGCKQDKGIVHKIETYPSGKIKREGFFLFDSVPIGKVLTYYQNGKIETMVIYDSSGQSNGVSYVFFENANIRQRINYIHNKAQGFVSDYDSTGGLIRNSFYYNDIKSGDDYEYLPNKSTTYGFFDFQDHCINRIDYDSAGSIIHDQRQLIFLDSTKVDLDSVGRYHYKLLLLLSNPLKTVNSIYIDYLDNNEKNIERDSIGISREPFFYQEKQFNTILAKIKILGKQFDSIANRTRYETLTIDINYANKKNKPH